MLVNRAGIVDGVCFSVLVYREGSVDGTIVVSLSITLVLGMAFVVVVIRGHFGFNVPIN